MVRRHSGLVSASLWSSILISDSASLWSKAIHTHLGLESVHATRAREWARESDVCPSPSMLLSMLLSRMLLSDSVRPCYSLIRFESLPCNSLGSMGLTSGCFFLDRRGEAAAASLPRHASLGYLTTQVTCRVPATTCFERLPLALYLILLASQAAACLPRLGCHRPTAAPDEHGAS